MRRIPSVFIKDLGLCCLIGRNYWGQPHAVPLFYKLSVTLQLQLVPLKDDLARSVSYADVAHHIGAHVLGSVYLDSLGLLRLIAGLLEASGIANYNREIVKSTTFELKDNRFHLKLGCLLLVKLYPSPGTGYVQLQNLDLLTKIGIFDFERQKKQRVSIDAVIDLNDLERLCGDDFNQYFRDVVEELALHVENTEFLTVEALAADIESFFSEKGISGVRDIVISKHNAVLAAESVGFALKSNDLQAVKPAPVAPPASVPSKRTNKICFLSFGSNIEPLANISAALALIRASGHTRILTTSSLYRTKPMYHKDQPLFVNGALKVETLLLALEFLEYVKSIEYGERHREKPFQNAPRTIDLDILMFDDAVVNLENLTVPHPKMLERSFVLDPLVEVLPEGATHPVLGTEIRPFNDPTLSTVIPVFRPFFNRWELWNTDFSSTPTKIMGIINVTPDLFSDGGYNLTLEKAFASAQRLVADGAEILDLGATLTKPGLGLGEGPDSEISRLVPLITKIRQSSDEKLRNVLLSVDTFYSKTARAVVDAGADIINDISMGMYDPEIHDVVAQTGVLYVLNHTRGVPANMTKHTQYSEFLPELSHEMAVCLSRAYSKGVAKWQVILDPGVGFAKTVEQNLELIRSVAQLRAYKGVVKDNEPTYNEKLTGKQPEVSDGSESDISFWNMPVLVGPSRKRFILKITNERLNVAENEKIVLGTSGVVMACIASGTDIVRVHDVAEMAKVAALGDAIYRNGQ